jgi:7TM-HD extracellular
MVKPLFRNLLPTVAAFSLILSTSAKELADYRIGDTVVEDVVAPVALMVVDAEATAALKEKEALRIPVAFRFDRTAAALVELEMREAFTLARSNFVRLMHSSFHHTKLEEYQLETEQFDKLLVSYQKRDKIFPLTTALAEEWALGREGFAEYRSIISRVRQVMERPIRVDNLTNAPKIGSQVTLVSVKGGAESIGLADLKSRGTNTSKTNLLTLSRARLLLLEKFGPDEEDAGRFAARCLKVNCFLEAELTQAARARHTDPLFVADNYQAGQIVARQGQRVDRKILAGFNQIQEKTVAGRLQQQVAQQKEQAEREKAAALQAQESNKWLFGGLIALGAISLVSVTWLLLRRKNAGTMLPAVVGTGAATSPADAAWQQRALVAEEKAARAQDAIRSGVVEQLKDKAVSSLVFQRGEMLEAQQAAAAEMVELERRLNELRAPLQERLKTYEGRIAELEKALATKDAENRELIRAKIDLMRQQLEAERTGSKLQFN